MALIRNVAMLACAGGGLLSSGCGAAMAGTGGQVLAIATYSNSSPAGGGPIGFSARATGPLHGTIRGSAACFSMGDGGAQTTLIWARGYSARHKPLQVLDDRGRTVALAGEVITIGGGYSPVSQARTVVGCGDVGSAWLVGSVDARRSGGWPPRTP